MAMGNTFSGCAEGQACHHIEAEDGEASFDSGDRLFVVGSAGALGKWNMEHSVELFRTSPGRWSVKLDGLGDEEVPCGSEYKYVMWRGAKSYWELGENRKVDQWGGQSSQDALRGFGGAPEPIELLLKRDIDQLRKSVAALTPAKASMDDPILSDQEAQGTAGKPLPESGRAGTERRGKAPSKENDKAAEHKDLSEVHKDKQFEETGEGSKRGWRGWLGKSSHEPLKSQQRELEDSSGSFQRFCEDVHKQLDADTSKKCDALRKQMESARDEYQFDMGWKMHDMCSKLDSKLSADMRNIAEEAERRCQDKCQQLLGQAVATIMSNINKELHQEAETRQGQIKDMVAQHHDLSLAWQQKQEQTDLSIEQLVTSNRQESMQAEMRDINRRMESVSEVQQMAKAELQAWRDHVESTVTQDVMQEVQRHAKAAEATKLKIESQLLGLEEGVREQRAGLGSMTSCQQKLQATMAEVLYDLARLQSWQGHEQAQMQELSESHTAERQLQSKTASEVETAHARLLDLERDLMQVQGKVKKVEAAAETNKTDLKEERKAVRELFKQGRCKQEQADRNSELLKEDMEQKFEQIEQAVAKSRRGAEEAEVMASRLDTLIMDVQKEQQDRREDFTDLSNSRSAIRGELKRVKSQLEEVQGQIERLLQDAPRKGSTESPSRKSTRSSESQVVTLKVEEDAAKAVCQQPDIAALSTPAQATKPSEGGSADRDTALDVVGNIAADNPPVVDKMTASQTISDNAGAGTSTDITTGAVPLNSANAATIERYFPHVEECNGVTSDKLLNVQADVHESTMCTVSALGSLETGSRTYLEEGMPAKGEVSRKHTAPKPAARVAKLKSLKKDPIWNHPEDRAARAITLDIEVKILQYVASGSKDPKERELWLKQLYLKVHPDKHRAEPDFNEAAYKSAFHWLSEWKERQTEWFLTATLA